MLVDHNERGQSVSGLEEADIVGLIDHHRVADFQTRTPPFVRMEPLGSTSTGGRVIAVKQDLAKISLISPVCTMLGEKIALSRRVDKHWRLIGWGSIIRGTTIQVSGSVTFEHRAINQRGEIVCSCLRMALLKGKAAG